MREIGCKTFQIFSDDIAFCKQNFNWENTEIIEGQNEFQDMALMTGAKHIIIANSSFSWWSAYLGKKQDQTVIAPMAWFGPAYRDKNTADVYCSNWIKM